MEIHNKDLKIGQHSPWEAFYPDVYPLFSKSFVKNPHAVRSLLRIPLTPMISSHSILSLSVLHHSYLFPSDIQFILFICHYYLSLECIFMGAGIFSNFFSNFYCYNPSTYNRANHIQYTQEIFVE